MCWTNHTIRVISTAALALLVGSYAMGAPAPNDKPTASSVNIRIRQRTIVQAGVVRVRDIADVVDGDQATRARIANLDLEDLTSEKPFAVIKPGQIRMRCLIAGLGDQQFHVTGSTTGLVDSRAFSSSIVKMGMSKPSVETITTKPDTIETIATRTIRQEIATFWQVPVDEVTVRLQKPISIPPTITAKTHDVVVRAYLPAVVEPGSVSAIIVLKTSESRPIQSNVLFTADHRPTTEGIGRIHVSDRQLRTGRIQLASNRNPVSNGLRTTTPIPTPIPKKVPTPIVVRTRDRIRLVARSKSGLRVSLADAEAMESGRIGDPIRVRNRRSKVAVTARVISATEAVIDI